VRWFFVPRGWWGDYHVSAGEVKAPPRSLYSLSHQTAGDGLVRVCKVFLFTFFYFFFERLARLLQQAGALVFVFPRRSPSFF